MSKQNENISREEALKKISLYNPMNQKTMIHPSALKKSLLSLPLSYMGYSGYLNPFTLESQANAKMPIQSLNEKVFALNSAMKWLNFL